MTSTMEGEPKPVAGYPAGYPPPHPGYQSTGYPSAQPGYSTTAGTAGIAYPYAAPPQTAYYHPNPYPAQSYEYRRSTLFRRLIVAMFAVFLILGAITFILWLVIRPHLPEFQVDSASVSHFNISDSQVTGDWDFAFTVRNPNKKMSIFYDSIKAGVFYRRDSLSETSVVPFYQGTKNLTSVRATFAAASTYVDLGIAKSIAGDRARGAVKFNVKLLAWVRFRSGVWRTRRRLMGVYCTDVNVAFPSNGVSGSLSGGSKECDVEL